MNFHVALLSPSPRTQPDVPNAMRSLTFSRRVLIGLIGVALVVGLTSPLLFRGWSVAGIAITVDLVVIYGAFRFISSFLTEQHQTLLHSINDQIAVLSAGKPGRPVQSPQKSDSFGELVTALDELARVTAGEVTGFRKQVQKLERSQTLFQSILENMVEGILVLDGERRVLYFNDAARQVLGCTDRSVEGRPVWEVLRATDLMDVLEVVYDSGNEFRKEIEFKRSRHIVEVTAVQFPLHPAPGVLIVLHDVTELRSLERMRREFVSNVSHELKTPLTSIQAYADTLLDGGLKDEENNRVFVERILEQSNRLQTLIRDMLRLARIESQSEAFLMRPVSLVKTLESCVDARVAVARSRNVELVLHSGGPSVEVQADPSGLQTIFDNLISNSINYSHDGGRVDVSWSVKDGEVIVSVQDNGIGIASEHQERVFERFYRVDKARSRGAGGTGLGLAIVKHLVTVFGGRVELESEAGQGSTFRIVLPVLESSTQSLPAVDGPDVVA